MVPIEPLRIVSTSKQKSMSDRNDRSCQQFTQLHGGFFFFFTCNGDYTRGLNEIKIKLQYSE